MLSANEIIRIIITMVFMLLGVLCFRFAHRVEQSRFPLTILGKKKIMNDHDDVIARNRKYSRYINVLAMLCFLNGVLFAYIANIKIDAVLALLFIVAGIMVVLFGYKKSYTS